MSDPSTSPPDAPSDGKRKRRRRRRRRSSSSKSGEASSGDNLDSVLIAEGGDKRKSEPRRSRGRRQSVDVTGPAVSLPATGRNPHRKRGSRPRRSSPRSPGGRKRRLSRAEMGELQEWLAEMPEALVSAIYKGLGGQPGRVTTPDRLIQLTAKAVAQGGRLGGLIKSMAEKDRKALAALLQASGIAHADEFHRELMLSFGGHEREWQRVMLALANKGLVFSSAEQDGESFYLVPEPLVDGLLAELGDELQLPVFSHPEVRVLDSRPFCPPLHFSVTSLATYIDQNAPRLTQRHEIYRHDQEEMDEFFGQIWESDSELFSFHLSFLMMHGMVELRGEYLSLQRDVMEEWLLLESEDQRDLLFRALDERFPMAEWILWSIWGATSESAKDITEGEPGGDWVAERPLVDLYRRWKRGEDWRERFQRGSFSKSRSSERESYSFAPLVRAGILELGQWGQEKFYRLSPRGRQLLHPAKGEGFDQFYLTPSFEIMAPAGLAPILLFRIGELGQLVGCDRANTYKITEVSIERALGNSWRRDDVLQFLRDNSQIGLPENVESTLKGWIGHRGDVELHDLMLLTVHRSQIRRFEGNKRLKPYILHRFAPGMYAVDRSRHSEIMAALGESRFSPTQDVRNYPGDPEQVEARNNLHKLVAEARQLAIEPAERGKTLIEPGQLQLVKGAKSVKAPGGKKPKAPELPPEVDANEIRQLIDIAISDDHDLEMIYVAKTGQRQAKRVQPQRLAFRSDSPVLVALDRDEDERRTYALDKIERMRIIEVSA